jgi:hypothetical protein
LAAVPHQDKYANPQDFSNFQELKPGFGRKMNGWPLRITLQRNDKEANPMEDTNATVAVFETHTEADEAVKELQTAGFDMKKLSVVGKDYHTQEQVVGYYNAGDRMKHWGKLGAFWGGLWGLLFGAAFFWVPGIGPVLVGGPLVAWIVAALEGAVLVGGISAIGAGLVSLGIPKNSIVEYESAIKAGKYVVVAHGTAEDVAKARNIMSTLKPSGLTDHVLEPAGAAAS